MPGHPATLPGHPAPSRPERCSELSALLANGDANPLPLAAQVRQLLVTCGVGDRLSGWGAHVEDLPDLAAAALHFRPVLENTPVELDRDALLAIYQAAWA